ncbi:MULTISPECIES: dicarboxylate/amino acid:cation symporter [unclassified Clostridium]|uniref:dicarboxylate/amino acid:cation symporter n=1 Tax=Clostridium TaxID=1485 RepID=UPI001C8C2323|nr:MULTISPECIES: dicarboxylate/amino acid:cation symporter [unclassified Clostridium]MBX9137845.1 dicarboxylate/amino acid:cation symporter [Clostridium sp. K12(2020)]MBX9143498.1 dicarboxylate/amino acid:cation symporter [Clostridium sp. K13]MDU2288551.1 dicarboxylate/amino acid:cation symporter [Clostridium celatum]
MKKLSLITRIFLCLVLGIAVGLLCGANNIQFPVRLLATFSGLFGSFLSFVIPLIIIGFIIPGIASLGSKSGKGLIITTVIAYVSTLVAGFAAYLVGVGILPKLIKGGVSLSEAGQSIEPYFTIEIPAIMGVMSALVLAFVLGIGLSKIKNSQMLKVVNEFNSIILMIVTKVLIPLVPIYIGCVFAKLSYSGEIFNTLKSFGIVYVILFSLQLLYIVLQYCIAGAIKKENPFKLIKNMIPAYMTAVGTQSSAATIPVTLQCVKKNQVSEEVLDFVVPLGATIHLAGDTITLVLTSMAVMYMNGQTPTFGMIVPFIFMLGVTMIAAPGVPGGGVMAALGLLESMLGFGAVEKPIMIALHAAQDSFGTATNVTGDGAIAIIVDYFISRKKGNSIEQNNDDIAS